MSSFTTPLILEHLDGKMWRLVEPFAYDVGFKESGETIIVPEGFECDLASIPRPLWWLYNPTGVWGKPGVVHDWLYHNAGLMIEVRRKWDTPDFLKEYSRKRADQIFLEGMKVLKIRFTARRLMYRAVRSFGWYPWNGYYRNNTEE